VDIADTDATAVIVAHMAGDTTLTTLLGGPGRVGGENKPPYPRIRVLDPPGDDRDMRWLIAPVLQIETYGDLDGTPGKAMLRRIHYGALQVLRDLPGVPVVPGQPVVTAVTFLSGGGWVPEPTGQPRYLSRISCHMHPAR
jgi:hypothetical protein